MNNLKKPVSSNFGFRRSIAVPYLPEAKSKPIGIFLHGRECRDKNIPEVAPLGDVPVLHGQFDLPIARRCVSRGDTDFRWAMWNGSMLAFGLQVGPDIMYWLANPRDARLWRCLQAWERHGRAELSVEFASELLCIAFPFHMPDEMKKLAPQRGDAQQYDMFLDVALPAIAHGISTAPIRSNIPRHPRLRAVHANVVLPCDIVAPH